MGWWSSSALKRGEPARLGRWRAPFFDTEDTEKTEHTEKIRRAFGAVSPERARRGAKRIRPSL
jgi:hypothetical protein